MFQPDQATLTSGIFQCPSLRLHSILLDHSSFHPVYVTGIVHFFDQVSSFICCLLTAEDVEVVVCCMSASVTFRPYGRTENDEIPGRWLSAARRPST